MGPSCCAGKTGTVLPHEGPVVIAVTVYCLTKLRSQTVARPSSLKQVLSRSVIQFRYVFVSVKISASDSFSGGVLYGGNVSKENHK